MTVQSTLSPYSTSARPRAHAKRWATLGALVVLTLLILAPLIAILWLSLRAPIISGETGPTFASFRLVLQETNASTWLRNSLGVTIAATVLTVIIAAPAGYVISRARSRLVSAYSLLLFVVQSFPVVLFVIPLFALFVKMGLADTLRGVLVVYVAASLSIACWMFAAYFDTIPRSLEEAAWMDGCSLFGGFVRIVLRNSLPGVLSTAIFGFLVAWNDYLIAVVFLRADSKFTLPVGLQTFSQQNFTDWGPVMALSVIMLIPPVLVFTALNKFFSVGGIGGSLAGQ